MTSCVPPCMRALRLTRGSDSSSRMIAGAARKIGDGLEQRHDRQGAGLDARAS